jgi:hypothetical protein
VLKPQDHRVHTEWQQPLSDAFIMMENLAQAGEGGNARPPPVTTVYLPSRTKLIVV